MFHRNAQLLCILVLLSTCWKGYSFLRGGRENHCLYRCHGSEYDVEDMYKRLNLVASTVANLIKEQKNFDSLTRGTRAEISNLNSQILELGNKNKILTGKLEQEKAMRISLQHVVKNQEDSLKRIQHLVRQTKRMVEVSSLKAVDAKKGLESLKDEVQRVLKNETLLFERLHSLEISNTQMAEALEKGNIVKRVNNLSTSILTLSDAQSQQKRHLGRFKSKMESLMSEMIAVKSSATNTSLRIDNLEFDVGDMRRKQCTTFKDIFTKPKLQNQNIQRRDQNLVIQRDSAVPQQNGAKTGVATTDLKSTVNSENPFYDQGDFTTLRCKSETDVNSEVGSTVPREKESTGMSSLGGVCNLQKSRGLCGKSYKRWYYDSLFDECYEFTYGGCLGNQNRFRTKAACEEMCKN